MLERYYNLFDASKDYTELLFRAGDGLQSRELNEIQSTFNHRLRGVADVLFKDGDIVEGGAARVDPDTGAAALSAGLIYLQGMVRPVGVGAFTIPVTGTFALGLRLQRVAVTELEDPSLREPAVGVRNYQEPGAGRVQERLVWGWSGDGEAGTFYPLYAVVDGLLQGREAPPNLDAVATAIAAYDRQSTGGTYLIEGLVASRQADVEGAEQVVRVSAGAARINGQSVTLPVDRRLTRLPEPDTGEIIAEPHLCESAGVERITTHRAPIATITQVTLTREITESVVHGAYSGAVDSLAQSPVIALISVTQGATTYAVGTDYSLVAGKVDWSAGGAEPAVGSTYEVTYRFIDTVTPTALDAEGFSVEGAVPGTLINVTYHWKRPRYDRLYLDPDGAFLWQTGVPHDDAPTIPAALSGRLLLATFFQSWRDGEDHITRDGARLVPMDELGAIRNNIGDIYTLLADQHLMLNASARESAAKKGLFVDSFRTHAQRDLGIAQNAWNDGGRLSLPITTRVDYVPNDITTDWVMPAHVDRVVIEQPAYSGTQLVNPYLAVEPIPAQCVLTPSVDNYSATDTTWVSPVWGSRSEVRTLSSQTVEMAIRTLSVAFALSGFGVGETVASMTFDGIPITPSDLVADASGRLTGRFVIPSGVPAGHKEVEIIGTGGSRAIAVYTAKNTLVSVEQQQVNVRASSSRSSSRSSSSGHFIAWGGGGLYSRGGATYSFTSSASRETFAKALNAGASPAQAAKTAGASCTSGDPVSQTFQLDRPTLVSGVDLWFANAGARPVFVMLRNVDNGVPTLGVLTAAVLAPEAITTTSVTRVALPPVHLEAGVEYALTILSEDTDVAVRIAETGQWDRVAGQWITQQPYQVGVMLTSSNNTTWTPHQTMDLAFRLLEPSFTETETIIELGALPVTHCSDLMVMSDAETFGADARVTFRLTLVDAPEAPVLSIQPWRGAALRERYTGDVRIEAILSGTASAGAALYPNTQLAWGDMDTSATYVSRAFPPHGGTEVTIRYAALIPSGATLTCELFDGSDWTAVALESTVPIGDDWVERTHRASGFVATEARVRLTLTGTTAARPSAANLSAVFV